MEAIECSEDSHEMGRNLVKFELNTADMVVGIAVSRRPPYVLCGLHYANEMSVPTVAIVCNKESEIGEVTDTVIGAALALSF